MEEHKRYPLSSFGHIELEMRGEIDGGFIEECPEIELLGNLTHNYVGRRGARSANLNPDLVCTTHEKYRTAKKAFELCGRLFVGDFTEPELTKIIEELSQSQRNPVTTTAYSSHQERLENRLAVYALPTSTDSK